MTSEPSWEDRYTESFIKAAQYIFGLTVTQDVLREVGRIIVRYFQAEWVAFARHGADGEIIFRDWSWASPSGNGDKGSATEAMKKVAADVLDTGFLASETVVLVEPYMATFLPLTEMTQTKGVLIIAHKATRPPDERLLNLYLGLAGIAGSTLGRISMEQELRIYQGHLEELVHARTTELRASNEKLAREIRERERAQVALQEKTTALSEANQALQAVNRELEGFSYSVSHDLRAPLRAIDGFSRMLLKDCADKLDDDGKRKLGIIRVNTQTMGRLIDDLLTFSRLGRKDMVRSRLDMEALVQSAWAELAVINAERRINLIIKRLPEGFGDPTLIKQVILNLLSNAIKFTKSRDRAAVEAGTLSQGGEDVYYIKDNGAGFDMAYYDKLFGVFQRLHGSEEFEGNGVGLAIVERIILRHGGKIWAEGKVDKGATFYFTIPGGKE